MAEYINLEKLIALKSNNEYMWYDLYDLEDFLADVKKECSADVIEVVHAHKGQHIGHKYYCSACGRLAYCENYCSNCGAKMDGEKNEAN